MIDYRQTAWLAVPWDTPIYPELVQHADEYIRLWGLGMRTVGDLDRLILAHGEDDLRGVFGLKRPAAGAIVAKLLVWSRRKFFAALAALEKEGA